MERGRQNVGEGVKSAAIEMQFGVLFLKVRTIYATSGRDPGTLLTSLLSVGF